jgi:hypothetical protein
MTDEPSVSGWAQARFGDHEQEVREAIAGALQEAVNDAQNAHAAGRSGRRFTFGWALYSRKHERLTATLEAIDGLQFKLVKPKGSAFPLAFVNGCLLLPFRYATDAKTSIWEARVTQKHVSDTMHALFGKFTQAQYLQGALFADDPVAEEEESDILGTALQELPDGTRLVLIAFACNEQAGLLNAWWGEGELSDTQGHVRWHGIPEELRLPAESPVRNLRLLPGNVTEPASPRRFDNAEIPPIDTQLRPKGQAPEEDQGPCEPPETKSDEQE